MQHIYKGRKIPARKRVPATPPATGFTTVPDGFIVGDLEINIDMARIAEFMGARALRAKGKICRDGYVVVKARNVKREGQS